MRNYKKRVADKLLVEKMVGKGAVLIEGPKWRGKTTTAEQIAKSVLYMANQNSIKSNLQMADFKPSRLLGGARPRLLDEWRLAPKLWDAVRFAVDHTPGFGHFILTGSTVPDEKSDEIKHSGTGRISRMKMRPMSLWESGESSGISLGDLFGQTGFDGGDSYLSLEELAFLTCMPPSAIVRRTVQTPNASKVKDSVPVPARTIVVFATAAAFRAVGRGVPPRHRLQPNRRCAFASCRDGMGVHEIRDSSIRDGSGFLHIALPVAKHIR